MLWWGLACGTPEHIPPPGTELPEETDEPVVEAPEQARVTVGAVQPDWPEVVDTGEPSWLLENRLVGASADFIQPIEGGLITGGYMWHGPVTGVHVLADEAERSASTLYLSQAAAYGDSGFVGLSWSEGAELFDGADWSEPVLWYGVEGHVDPTTGDVTGDGVPDIASVSTWYWEDAAYASILLFDGSYRGEFNRTAAHSVGTNIRPGSATDFGGDVALPGDVDGDGVGDVVISGYDGYWVFNGPMPGAEVLVSDDADVTVLTDESVYTVKRARDVDGDGLQDVLVSAADWTRVRTASEPAYASLYCLFIHRAAALGDADGDGSVEVAVAMAGEDTWLVELTSAGTFSCDVDGTRVDGSGHSVRTAAYTDLDQDGQAELALGLSSTEPYTVVILSLEEL